jgi:clan AA aspartic protease (TIGR02281 family)
MVGSSGTLAAAVGLALCVAASAARAEIYKWVDQSGRMHFAQTLHQVPAPYRIQAESNAAQKPSGPDRIQTYEVPASIAPRPRAVRSYGAPSGSAGRRYTIPVQRAGNMLRVVVRINNVVDAPFYIDTGASDVAVPRWVVEKAGIDLEGARTGVYGTANGTIEVQKITLDSVELGGARVEGVPASVSDTMQVGLLGLSYFNHFQYSVDPTRGIVTLVENGMARDGILRGGRSKHQWRSEFAQVHRRVADVEREKAGTPSSHGREHARLEARIRELERQYEVLEDEADDAHVPFGWRD